MLVAGGGADRGGQGRWRKCHGRPVLPSRRDGTTWHLGRKRRHGWATLAQHGPGCRGRWRWPRQDRGRHSDRRRGMPPTGVGRFPRLMICREWVGLRRSRLGWSSAVGKDQCDAPRSTQEQRVPIPQGIRRPGGQAQPIDRGAICAAYIDHLKTTIAQWMDFRVPGGNLPMREGQPVLAAAPNGQNRLVEVNEAEGTSQGCIHGFLLYIATVRAGVPRPHDLLLVSLAAWQHTYLGWYMLAASPTIPRGLSPDS